MSGGNKSGFKPQTSDREQIHMPLWPLVDQGIGKGQGSSVIVVRFTGPWPPGPCADQGLVGYDFADIGILHGQS